jgi:hypothetical protein
MESEKVKTGMKKVNRQGYKVEPGKDQRIFPRNFMLIRLNLPELKYANINNIT